MPLANRYNRCYVGSTTGELTRARDGHFRHGHLAGGLTKTRRGRTGRKLRYAVFSRGSWLSTSTAVVDEAFRTRPRSDGRTMYVPVYSHACSGRSSRLQYRFPGRSHQQSWSLLYRSASLLDPARPDAGNLFPLFLYLAGSAVSPRPHLCPSGLWLCQARFELLSSSQSNALLR